MQHNPTPTKAMVEKENLKKFARLWGIMMTVFSLRSIPPSSKKNTACAGMLGW
jgi:hypothetical protein